MERCFQGQSAYILLAATPEIVDARAEAQRLAYALSAAARPNQQLPSAWWLPANEAAGAGSFYVVASERYVFLVTLFPIDNAGGTYDALLVDIAREVQARGGGPPTSEAARDVPAELAAVLVADPPPGYEASPPILVEDDAERWRRARQAPGLAAYPALDLSAREAELFARESTGVVRTFSSGSSVVFLTLIRHPHSLVAAADLGTVSRLDYLNSASLPRADQIEDAVTYRIEPGLIGIIFRRDEYVVHVQAASPESTTDVTPDVATQWALVELATRQAQLLPDGSSDPYFFPSRTTSIATAIGVTTAVYVLIAGVGWIAVARSRRRRRSPEPLPPDVVVVSPAAARRRWGSVRLTVVQIVALNAVVVGLVFVIDGVELWSSAIVAGGVALGVLFTSWQAHAELRQVGARGARRRVLAVSGGAVATGLAAGACLAGGVAAVANGAESLAFGPTWNRLERSVQLGISPRALSIAVASAGAALVLVGGVLLRLARRRLRASAARVRAADRRPPVLYLRSFEDDDDLRVATLATARRPFLEMLRPRGSDPFEEALAWELAPHGPVVAVGRPGRALASLGAAREYLNDDEWRHGVSDRMADAAAIVVVIAATGGLRWEVGEIARDRHLGKSVFVFPPTGDEELRRRWQFVDDVLDGLDVRNSPFPTDAAAPLTAHLLASGTWQLTVASHRDEASYCAAIDVAMSVATSHASPSRPDLEATVTDSSP